MKAFKTLIFTILIVCGTLFANDAADAAQVIEKTTTIVSGPTVDNGKVSFTVGGNVKLIRHAKALNSSFAPTVVTGGTKAITRITRFEYGCPGYYTTRLYSDVSGTQLIGYVQVYVSTSDINKSGCESIQAPPTATPPKPPAPTPTHPDPLKTETLTLAPLPTPKKYELHVPEPPIIEPTPQEPEPEPFDQMCEGYLGYGGNYTNYTWKQLPETDGTSKAHCCPSTQQIFYKKDLSTSDYLLFDDTPETNSLSWGCGILLEKDIEETYCPANQIYDRATNQCKVSSETNRLSYEQPLYNSEGVSAIDDDIPPDPTDPTEPDPTDPTDPTEPDPTEPEPEQPTPPRDPNLVYDVFNAKFCKLDSGDYAVLIGPSEQPESDLHALSRSAREKDYYLSANYDDVFADYTENGNYVIKKDAVNFELQFFKDNTGHGDVTKKLATDTLTKSSFSGAVDCMFDGETNENDSSNPETQPPLDCEVDIWHEDCLPSCYCPTLDAYMPGLGFMCCIWECPGLDAIIQDGKNFLADDLVGTATPPPVPEFTAGEIPNIFDVLNNVDKNTPAPITTTEDPQLGDSTFDANDIKMNAEEMPVREDPTGGFDIKNPLDTLPQDGSTAPRPNNMNEQINYPQQSSGGGNINGNISYPQSNSGSVTPPSGNGSATPPGYNDEVQYPGMSE